jgi:hypothetical protein
MGRLNFKVLSISLFSLILLTGILGFEDAFALKENKNVTITLEPSILEINEWNVNGVSNAFDAIDDPGLDWSANDGEATYVSSDVNNALQFFSAKSGQFQGATGINYIEIFSVGKNFDDDKKPTKYSIGVAKGTNAIAFPNGGEIVGQDWEPRSVKIWTDPFSGNNAKSQGNWTVSQLHNMNFTDGDELSFVIEQNTAAKNIGVTKFWVIVNTDFEFTVNIDKQDPDGPNPTQEYWGEPVTITGQSKGVGGNLQLEVNFGDGTDSVIVTPEADGSWTLYHKGIYN